MFNCDIWIEGTNSMVCGAYWRTSMNDDDDDDIDEDIEIIHRIT